MNEVYDRLSEANSLMGNPKTSLTQVWDLLKECDEIVKQMTIPNYEPEIKTVPILVQVQTPVVFMAPEVKIKSTQPEIKKKNPWVEYLQNYSKEHNIPYHLVMKIPDIKQKYQLHKEGRTIPEVVPEPVAVPVSVPEPKADLMEQIRNYQHPRPVMRLFFNELKYKMLTYVPKGKIYGTMYVRRSAGLTIKLEVKDEDMLKYNALVQTHKTLSEDKTIPLRKVQEAFMEQYNFKKYCPVYHKGRYEGKWDDHYNLTKKDKTKIAGTKGEQFCIPVKCFAYTFNYEAPIIHWKSVINLKYYSPVTKKTTNKGLTAVIVYEPSPSQREAGDRTEWHFNGFKSHLLKKVCEENGYISKKGDQYGDYAIWYTKL